MTETPMVFRVVQTDLEGGPILGDTFDRWQDWPRKDDKPRALRQALALSRVFTDRIFAVRHVEATS